LLCASPDATRVTATTTAPAVLDGRVPFIEHQIQTGGGQRHVVEVGMGQDDDKMINDTCGEESLSLSCLRDLRKENNNNQ
jgi:hypothetical protein